MLDFGKAADDASGFDDFEAVAGGLLDGLGVNAVPLGQIGLHLLDAFAKLTCGADIVAIAVVVEADGEVDQALQEPAVGLLGRRPDLFEDLVAFEELAAVEQLDALLKEAFRVLHARLSVYFTARGRDEAPAATRE